MKLSDALEGYWLSRRLDLSPNTIRDYDLTFRRLQAFAGDVEIGDIDANVIRRFLAHLPNEFDVGNRTLSNVWTALSSFWTWAEIDLNIAHALRGKIKRPRFVEVIPDAFTHEELTALVKGAKFTKGWRGSAGKYTHTRRPTAQRDEAIILVLVDTGIRATELCSLTVGDYDKQRGRLHIRHGKGNKSRNVYPGDTARSALWKYLAGRDDARPTAPLIVTRSGRRMDRTNLGHLLQRAGQRAGVDGVHPPRLRPTFAISSLRNGGNVHALQAILGHETMDTVRIYVRLAQIDLANAQHNASPADAWRL